MPKQYTSTTQQLGPTATEMSNPTVHVRQVHAVSGVVEGSHLWIHQEDSPIRKVPSPQHAVRLRDAAGYVLQNQRAVTIFDSEHH